MNLLEVQQQMLQAVLAERSSTPKVIADADDRGLQGLAVYRHGYRARLREALIQEFSGLQLLMGRRFGPMLDSYIEAHPSGHYNIRWYGAGLAAFLEYGMPWRAHPAWAEMATLDWAISSAFDAADEPVLQPAALANLAALDWPQLQLQLQHHLQQLPSQYQLTAFRRAADQHRRRPRLLRQPRRRSLLVWRQSWQVHYRLLADDEHAVLNAVQQGARFPELCDLMAGFHGPNQAPTRMLKLLQTWLQDGLLRGFASAP